MIYQQSYNPHKLSGCLPALLFFVLITSIISCSTTHKNKTVTKEESRATVSSRVDSTVKAQIDSLRVKKDNSTSTATTEQEYERKTVIEYNTMPNDQWPIKNSDTAFANDNGTGIIDYLNDYAGAKPAADKWGSPGVKSVTIYERGTRKATTVTKADKVDSAASHTNAAVELHKAQDSSGSRSVTTKVKEVKRTSYWGWLWLLLIIPVYIVYRNRKPILGAVKKIFA